VIVVCVGEKAIDDGVTLRIGTADAGSASRQKIPLRTKFRILTSDIA
jgi:hypothetical protein